MGNEASKAIFLVVPQLFFTIFYVFLVCASTLSIIIPFLLLEKGKQNVFGIDLLHT